MSGLWIFTVLSELDTRHFWQTYLLRKHLGKATDTCVCVQRHKYRTAFAYGDEVLCSCTIMEKMEFLVLLIKSWHIIANWSWSYKHLFPVYISCWRMEYWQLGYLKDHNPDSTLPNFACPKGIQQSAETCRKSRMTVFGEEVLLVCSFVLNL